MSHLIKIAPVFKEMIWGGKRLREKFGFDIPSDFTGECWAVSSHPEGDCYIDDEAYQGMTLSALYEQRKDLFGNFPTDEFPLMVKFIDANQDLSIQVHPDDELAKEYGLSHGKAEAWSILDCDLGAEIVVGHTCKSKDELEHALHHPTSVDWLQKFRIRPNQFYYLPGGTVHAVGKNTFLYEIDQNSNVSYRIYDYDRVDGFGQRRPLHLDKAKKAIKVPDRRREAIPQRIITHSMKHTIQIRSEHFNVEKWEIDEETTMHFDNFFMIIGFFTDGIIDGQKAKAGDHFIALHPLKEVTLSPGSTVMVTYIPEKKK